MLQAAQEAENPERTVALAEFDRALADGGDRIERWAAKHLTELGLLRSDPWWTPRLLERLIGPTHESVRRRLVAAAEKLAAPGGYLGPQQEPFGPAALAVLRRKFGAGSIGDLLCDDAEIATVRHSSENARLPILGFDFRDAFRVDWRIEGKPFLFGAWQTVATIDGREIIGDDGWQNVCCSTDADGAYLEFRTDPRAGVRLERQIYLSRRLPIVFAADCLRSQRAGRLSIAWRLPLAGEATSVGTPAHRGQRLTIGDLTVAALPVGLPPSPLAHCDGAVRVDHSGLIVEQTGAGTSIHMPFAFCYSRGGRLPLDAWQPLTVTSDGDPTPPHEARAIRIPVGGRSMVWYRAARTPRRYAFLGHQTFDETVLGEFTSAGTVNCWLRLESSAAPTSDAAN